MKVIRIFVCISLISIFNRCIGTDVLAELEANERIVISESVDSLAVNESFSFQAILIQSDGTEEMADVQWSSSDLSVIQIDPSGNAIAIMEGTATITARYLQLQDSVLVHAGEVTSATSSRTGEFSGLNNYTVNGGFVLERNAGDLLLSFDENFATSNGPGLYVYLSSSADNVNGGFEVGPLQSSQGVQEYLIDDSITLNTYDYVIIHCKPFGIPFGAGPLN